MLSKKLIAFKNKLHGLTPAEFDRIVIGVLKENEEEVLDLNKEQLLEGKTSKGTKVGAYRNKGYAKYKKKLNPRARGTVDLKLTGNFHDRFYLRTDRNLKVWSRDQKTDGLVSKYGGSIFGLAPKSVRALSNILAPKILKALRKYLGVR